MKLNLNELMKDYRAFNNYDDALRIANKWEKTGLLEGINKNDEARYLGMARLLDNEAKYLVTESNKTSTAAGGEEWSNIALPLVRRTFGKLVSQEILSVQPMSMPSGLVFWLDFKYGTTKPSNTTIFSSSNLVYGDPDTGTGPYYDFQYGYTKNYISASAVAATVTSASLQDINYDLTLSASLADLKKYTIAQSALSNVDADAVGAIRLTDANIALQYPKYNAISGSSVTFLVSGAHETAVTTVEYLKKNTEAARGDFEAGQTGVGAIPETSISLRQDSVVATTRKLKSKWTPELAQDLAAYHSLDAEAELTNLMSEQVSLEIDMENISMVLANAALSDYWSVKVADYVSSTDGSSVPGTFYGTQAEWYQTLLAKMNKMSNEIYRRNLRIPANFVVVGSKLATVLESMAPSFVADGTAFDSLTYSMGIAKMGTLQNKWTVYKNANFRDDIILVGAKGASFMDTGAVYAPYIGLMTSDIIYDPDTMEPIKFAMTRGGKKMVRDFLYGIIYVKNTHLI